MDRIVGKGKLSTILSMVVGMVIRDFVLTIDNTSKIAKRHLVIKYVVSNLMRKLFLF